MYERHLKRRTVIKATYGDALAILFKGRDHLPKGNIVGSLRNYDLLIYGSLLKCLRFEGHDFFSEGNRSGRTLEVYMCKLFNSVHLSLLLGSLTFYFNLSIQA